MKSKPRELVAIGACALLAAAAGVVSFDAHATTFKVGGVQTKQVFCDMPTIQGDFRIKESRYASSGTCVELQGVSQPLSDPDVSGRSEFDDYSHGKELFRADWTTEGGYDLTTHEAWEKTTFPAPTIDQRTAAGRPYGRFESKLLCDVDPWLESAAHCSVLSRTATGSLGDMEGYLRNSPRPFTSRMKPAQTQALHNSQQAFLKLRAALAPQVSMQPKDALRSITLPEILEPRASSTHAPQTPMKIRVAGPRNLKAESYELQFETRQPDGTWRVQTNVLVTANEAEGPLGYKGFGWHEPGTGTQMTAMIGTYRLRARVMRPSQGEYGAYREFTVAGEPGPGPNMAPKTNVFSGLGRASATAAAPLQKTVSPVQSAARPAALDWSRAAVVDKAPQTTLRGQP